MIFFKKNFILLIIFFFFLFFPSKIFAEVLINEFYPNPQTQEKEWVEFYNASSSSADLSNYVFDDDNDFYSDAGSGAKIFLKGILAANSLCYWELDSYLNNNGDTPTLFKTDSKLVDTYRYKTTQKGKSFSRVPNGGAWQENIEPSKTPINCLDLIPTPTLTSTPIPSPFFTLTPTPLQSPTPTLSPTFSLSPTQNPSPTEIPIPTPISYQNIYLYEVYPNPQTGENEWVEIYNDNDFIVNLNNWYIDDLEDGGSSPKKFSLTIQPKNYASFDLSTAIFNNDGDSVRLLDFDKKEKDSFEYKNSQKGKSFGRISLETDDFCLQEPSKNQKNNLCLNPTPTQEVTPTAALITSHLSSIATSPTKTMLPFIKKSNQNPYHYQSVSNIKTAEQNNSALINKKTDVLGIYNKRKTNRYSFFSFLSLSYSVLSAFGIIIKTVKHFS